MWEVLVFNTISNTVCKESESLHSFIGLFLIILTQNLLLLFDEILLLCMCGFLLMASLFNLAIC